MQLPCRTVQAPHGVQFHTTVGPDHSTPGAEHRCSNRNVHTIIHGSTGHSSQRCEHPTRAHQQRDSKQKDLYLDWGFNFVLRDEGNTICSVDPVSKHAPGTSSYRQCPEQTNLEEWKAAEPLPRTSWGGREGKITIEVQGFFGECILPNYDNSPTHV